MDRQPIIAEHFTMSHLDDALELDQQLVPTRIDEVVVISRFAVVNGMTAEVKQSFRDRPHLVDDADGFIRMEVLSPHDHPDEIWLMTWWRSETDYQVWHRSHNYRTSHAGIPKGLRLDPRSTEIRVFEHVCS